MLDTLIPIEHELRDETGRLYLTSIRPYRSGEDRIEGVVITFVDINQRRKQEDIIREAKDYAESTIEMLHEPLVVLHPDLTVKSCSLAFSEHFHVSRNETRGRRIYDLGNGQWNIRGLHTLLEEALPHSSALNDYEVVHDFDDIGHRVLLLNARRQGQDQDGTGRDAAIERLWLARHARPRVGMVRRLACGRSLRLIAQQ